MAAEPTATEQHGVSGQPGESDAPKLVDPERVAAVKASLIDHEEATRLADLFKLLGDPTRTRILFALVEGEELCVADLAEAVGIAESRLSHALRLLRTAGVVKNRRDGRMIFYSLDDAHIRMLLELSHEHLGHE